jgi:hypothetical protein
MFAKLPLALTVQFVRLQFWTFLRLNEWRELINNILQSLHAIVKFGVLATVLFVESREFWSFEDLFWLQDMFGF